MQAHAVVLGLPVKVCVGRAARRVGHEGGLEGAAAPRVVHMMHSEFVKAGPPTKMEGLASIMVRLYGACMSEPFVQVEAWINHRLLSKRLLYCLSQAFVVPSVQI